MRTPILMLGLAVVAVGLVSGCSKPEQKLGRGVRNMTEFARLGEMQRAVQQDALFEGTDYAYTTGVITGFGKSLARTAVGVYEVVTFPIPPYGPVLTNYVTARPQFPDGMKGGLPADPVMDNSTYLGFSGGEIFPMVPGSRFEIFGP